MVILGCGYTGRRVAQRFLNQGARVIATSRHPRRLAGLGMESTFLDTADGASIASFTIPRQATVLYSIPATAGDSLVFARLPGAARVVYLSTTGVYGAQRDVDAGTPVAPETPQSRLRVQAEMAAGAGPWQSMILRPAAIYGPGRGVHTRMQAGTYTLPGGGHHWISRIHVDDLAAQVEAALRSGHTGAYPVADEEPCAAREIAGFCAEKLGLPMPPESSETPRSNRRVDGSAIRRLLGVPLKYPSYRTGIPASIAGENV